MYVSHGEHQTLGIQQTHERPPGPSVLRCLPISAPPYGSTVSPGNAVWESLLPADDLARGHCGRPTLSLGLSDGVAVSLGTSPFWLVGILLKPQVWCLRPHRRQEGLMWGRQNSRLWVEGTLPCPLPTSLPHPNQLHEEH